MASVEASFLEDSDTTDDGDLDVQESAGEAEASAPEDDKRRTGKVKRWGRCCGLITPSDGGQQLFAHYEDIISQPEFRWIAVAENELVEFSTEKDPKNGKPRAVKITGPGGRKLKYGKTTIKLFDIYGLFTPIDPNAPKYCQTQSLDAHEKEQLPRLKQKYPEKSNRQLKELARKVWNELSESEQNELSERLKKELYSREGYLDSAKHKQFVADMREWTKLCQDSEAPKRPSLEGLETAEAVRVAQQYNEDVEAYKETERYQEMASRLREWAESKKYATRETAKKSSGNGKKRKLEETEANGAAAKPPPAKKRKTEPVEQTKEAKDTAKGNPKSKLRKQKKKLIKKGKVQAKAKATPKGKPQSKLQKKKIKMKGKRPAKKRRTGGIKSE